MYWQASSMVRSRSLRAHPNPLKEGPSAADPTGVMTYRTRPLDGTGNPEGHQLQPPEQPWTLVLLAAELDEEGLL